MVLSSPPPPVSPPLSALGFQNLNGKCEGSFTLINCRPSGQSRSKERTLNEMFYLNHRPLGVSHPPSLCFHSPQRTDKRRTGSSVFIARSTDRHFIPTLLPLFVYIFFSLGSTRVRSRFCLRSTVRGDDDLAFIFPSPRARFAHFLLGE